MRSGSNLLSTRVAPTSFLNLTGFAVSSPGADSHHTPFTDADCPVLQVILSGGTEELARGRTWPRPPRSSDERSASRGGWASDHSAISFKKADGFDAEREVSIVRHDPLPDRITFCRRDSGRLGCFEAARRPREKSPSSLPTTPTKTADCVMAWDWIPPAGIAACLKRLREEGYDPPDSFRLQRCGDDMPPVGADQFWKKTAGW